ncbi:hypothetical protein GCM10009593_12800 [Microlunatus antarcticus]|uniref:Uncharacterized protein n=1 Tax=Microlunatus antarcticus TaxID=53388 RepID=A0A7W5JWH5_9ACTN|nr:hypothetical protein [Microlunatus antarcticus]MBB3327475.1 hypothetical protein [Microlunatus antarcticus]
MSPGDANRRPRAGSGDQTKTAGTRSGLIVSLGILARLLKRWLYGADQGEILERLDRIESVFAAIRAEGLR